MKTTEKKELSDSELLFYRAEVARVDAMIGTAQAFDAENPSLMPTKRVTLAEHRAGKVLAAVVADQTGDPYLLDPRPVDPLVVELRERLSSNTTGDYLDE